MLKIFRDVLLHRIAKLLAHAKSLIACVSKSEPRVM